MKFHPIGPLVMVVVGISVIAPTAMTQQPETPIIRNRAGACSDQDLAEGQRRTRFLSPTVIILEDAPEPGLMPKLKIGISEDQGPSERLNHGKAMKQLPTFSKSTAAGRAGGLSGAGRGAFLRGRGREFPR